MSQSDPSLRTIFLEALELPDPSDRARYLAKACGPDTAQRRKIEELISAHMAAGGFLVTEQDGIGSGGPGPTPKVSLAGEVVGSMIGRYKLLQ